MAREEIEIEISPSGKVTAKTIGYKGKKCLDIAEVLARIVGREESRQLTSEYYESELNIDQHVEVKQRRY
jgi:hypothetical protein